MSTTPYADLQTIARKSRHFISTYNCLIRPLHLMWILRPSSGGRIISFACIWHITTSKIALTSCVVKSVHHNPELCPRATSVCVPLPHRLTCLCRDLSRACIGMFKSHLLRPYYVDDLWTTVHHPDMEHRLCHRNRLTILEFLLSSFLTPKRMKRSRAKLLPFTLVKV